MNKMVRRSLHERVRGKKEYESKLRRQKDIANRAVELYGLNVSEDGKKAYVPELNKYSLNQNAK